MRRWYERNAPNLIDYKNFPFKITDRYICLDFKRSVMLIDDPDTVFQGLNVLGNFTKNRILFETFEANEWITYTTEFRW